MVGQDSGFRLGVDVGGTHSDLVLYEPRGQAVLVEKVASTPADPAAGVLEGLRRLLAAGGGACWKGCGGSWPPGWGRSKSPSSRTARRSRRTACSSSAARAWAC